MAPLSYSAALVLKSEDAFAPVVQFVALPLLLLSGIFLPLQLAPDWLQTLADLNPVSYAVDAVRAAFNGHVGRPCHRRGVDHHDRHRRRRGVDRVARLQPRDLVARGPRRSDGLARYPLVALRP